MSKAIPLKEYGIRLFVCRLFNHDYLLLNTDHILKHIKWGRYIDKELNII